jgi:hypothetical protein
MSFKDILQLCVTVAVGFVLLCLMCLLFEYDLEKTQNKYINMRNKPPVSITLFKYSEKVDNSYITEIAFHVLLAHESGLYSEKNNLRKCLIATIGGYDGVFLQADYPEEEVVQAMSKCSAGLNYYP